LWEFVGRSVKRWEEMGKADPNGERSGSENMSDPVMIERSGGLLA
jgi:hypothetical protein